jgi:hypothetical protein
MKLNDPFRDPQSQPTALSRLELIRIELNTLAEETRELVVIHSWSMIGDLYDKRTTVRVLREVHRRVCEMR